MLLLLYFLVAVSVVFVVVVATGIGRIGHGKVGVVRRKFGHRHPDDEGFSEIRAHGSAGYQAATLKADERYILPRLLYEVKKYPRTRVPAGTIGVVVALDGARLSPDQTLGKHVECDDFQDGRAFLLSGGQKGRQLGILPGDASYDINPKLFKVFTVDNIDTRSDLTADDLTEIRIPEGITGVVVVRVGEPVDKSASAVGRHVQGHQSFQLPSVFLANNGQQGVQKETLNSGGIYRINPWFAQVERVPTRVLVLEWTKKPRESVGAFDSKLDRIRVNIEGYWLQFDMTQTIQIPAEAAPRLVSEFGQGETGRSDVKETAPVRRFVERVLGPLVEGYFQTGFGENNIFNFVSRPDKICLDLEDKVRQALDEWGVVAVSTSLHEFEPEGVSLDELRRRRAEERERKAELENKQENTKIEEATKRIQLETELSRQKIKLQAQVELLGKDSVTKQLLLAELVKANVPDVVVGNPEMLLGYMPLANAQYMIDNVLRASKTTNPPFPPQLSAASEVARDSQPEESEVQDKTANEWWKQIPPTK
jgi:SPFH domain / Band 7 family